MDGWQIGFDIAIAIAGFFGGYILDSLRRSIDDMKTAEKELMSKMQTVEVLIAGSYVRRDELEKAMQPMLAKLQHIEDRILEYQLKENRRG